MRALWLCVLAAALGGASQGFAQAPSSPEAAVPAYAEVRYLEVLAAAPSDTTTQEATRRLLHQLWPVLPADVRAAAGPGPDALRPGAGADLAAWWHAQDPLPATPRNERLVAHLQRVAHAEAQYADTSAAGYDVRGETYVRFGAPARIERIRLHSLSTSTSPMASRAKRNELWRYRTRPPTAFLFVRDGRRGWRPGTPLDVLPDGLRRPKVGPRGAEWSVLATLALHDITRHLAFADPNYVSLFYGVDDVWLTVTQRALELGIAPARLATIPADRLFRGAVGRTFLDLSFFNFVDQEHRFASELRDRALPVSFGVETDAAVAFPVALRAARFREAGGRTAIDLVWAPEPGAFVGLDVPASVVASTATVRSGGEREDRARRSAPLPARARAAGQTIPVQSARLRAGTAPWTAAVQLEVVASETAVNDEASDEEEVLPWRGVAHVGPVAPLTAEPGALLVSDPLPHLLDASVVEALAAGAPRALAASSIPWRYPYAIATPGAWFGIYVEAYDLPLEDGRSAYAVHREVHYTRDGERVFVSASTTDSGAASPTGREFIVLQVPEDAQPGDVVEFSGTLQDARTGRAGAWALAFDVVESAAPTDS